MQLIQEQQRHSGPTEHTHTHTQQHMHGSPYEGVLGRGLFGASQDANVTNGRFGGVAGNELDAESPLPEGLLLWGGGGGEASISPPNAGTQHRL